MEGPRSTFSKKIWLDTIENVLVDADTRNAAIGSANSKGSGEIDQESMVRNTTKLNKKLRSFNADAIKSGQEIQGGGY